MFKELLGITSECSQKVDVDLAKASRVALVVKETLRETRSKDSFHGKTWEFLI